VCLNSHASSYTASGQNVWTKFSILAPQKHSSVTDKIMNLCKKETVPTADKLFQKNKRHFRKIIYDPMNCQVVNCNKIVTN
jgi:hypothetical protein